MKLKDGFITHETGGEQILVGAGTDFNGLVRSNSTAAFIIDCLKTETTEAEIVGKILEKYEADEKTVSADVKKIVSTLREIGAIDD